MLGDHDQPLVCSKQFGCKKSKLLIVFGNFHSHSHVNKFKKLHKKWKMNIFFKYQYKQFRYTD